MERKILEGNAAELEAAMQEAYSIESMAAHGAGERKTTYIGAARERGITYWFYRDETGCYWYRDSISEKYDRIAAERRRQRRRRTRY